MDKTALTTEDETALQDKISILKVLKYNNVIQLYNVFDKNNKYYLAMERMGIGEIFDQVVKKAYYN